MAAGDFTASALPDILIRMEQMFSGQRHTPEFNQPIETIKALAERQTVRFDSVPSVLDTKNCVGVKATFLKSCDNTVDTTITDCEIGGTETESDSVTIANNLLYSKSFKVLDSDCKDVYKGVDKIAYLMGKTMVDLENAINEAAIAFLLANSQDNTATLPDSWDNTDADVIGIPSAEIKPEALAEIFYQAQINNLYSPFMVSGRNFYTSKVLGDFRSAGSDNVDAIFNSPLGDIVFDPKNIDTLTSLQSTFAVDPSGYAFWASNQFDMESPERWDDQYNTMVWRQRAPRLMFRNGGSLVPVYFDVRKQTKCAVTSNVTWKEHHYQIIFRGGLQLGPQVCSTAETGILHYKAV